MILYLPGNLVTSLSCTYNQFYIISLSLASSYPVGYLPLDRKAAYPSSPASSSRTFIDIFTIGNCSRQTDAFNPNDEHVFYIERFVATANGLRYPAENSIVLNKNITATIYLYVPVIFPGLIVTQFTPEEVITLVLWNQILLRWRFGLSLGRRPIFKLVLLCIDIDIWKLK